MVLKSDSTNINLNIQPEAEHITEDRLDAYVLQTFLDGPNDSPIQQHINCCHICQARLEETWDFIQALRQTIRNETVFSPNSLENEISVN